jgi:hypothetical protein
VAGFAVTPVIIILKKKTVFDSALTGSSTGCEEAGMVTFGKKKHVRIYTHLDTWRQLCPIKDLIFGEIRINVVRVSAIRRRYIRIENLLVVAELLIRVIRVMT